MKRISILLLIIYSCLPLAAQTDSPSMKRQWDDTFAQEERDSSLSRAMQTDYATTDSLGLIAPSLPLEMGSYGVNALSPFGTAVSDFGFRLHEGFNASFGLSMTAGLGKHAPKGVGFAETAAFAYVAPLGKRWSVAGGLFAENMDWGSYRRTSIGVGGALAYQPSDNVRLYLYGQRNFVSRVSDFRFTTHHPVLPYWDNLRDKIGVAAEFKVGENAMIGISVERRQYGN